MKILIVEDDKHLNKAISEMLKNVTAMMGKMQCMLLNKIFMI